MGLQNERKVQVVFHGYIHHPFNLEGIDPIVTNLTDALSQHPRGRKILLLESASFTPHTALGEATRMERMGIFKHSVEAGLATKLGRHVSSNELAKYIQDLSVYTLQTLIDNRTTLFNSEEGIHWHVLCQALDNIRERNSFSIRFESHNINLIGSARAFRQQLLFYDSSMTVNWNDGNFSAALDAAKSIIPVQNSYAVMRDEDTIKGLTTEIKKMLAGKGGVIFILFGATHDWMIDLLKKEYKHNRGVEFIKHIPTADFPELVLIADFRNKRVITEIRYARRLLSHVCSKLVAKYFLGADKAYEYATRYETIERAIREAAETPSFEDIQRMCEKQEDPLEFLRQSQSTPVP